MSKKEEPKKKKEIFHTFIVLETNYDPSDLGIAQIVLDVSSGGTKCLRRKTKKKS